MKLVVFELAFSQPIRGLFFTGPMLFIIKKASFVPNFRFDVLQEAVITIEGAIFVNLTKINVAGFTVQNLNFMLEVNFADKEFCDHDISIFEEDHSVAMGLSLFEGTLVKQRDILLEAVATISNLIRQTRSKHWQRQINITVDLETFGTMLMSLTKITIKDRIIVLIIKCTLFSFFLIIQEWSRI